MFRKILVAHDGSDGAWRAFRAALELSRVHHAELHLLGVEEHLPHYAATVGEVLEEQREENGFFSKLASAAWDEAQKFGVTLHVKILPGHEVETIVRYAEEGHFDLLVVGRTGHSGIWRKHMGSTSSQIAFHAPCSILVVK